jgi:hypothetical protein
MASSLHTLLSEQCTHHCRYRCRSRRNSNVATATDAMEMLLLCTLLHPLLDFAPTILFLDDRPCLRDDITIRSIIVGEEPIVVVVA